MFIGREDEINKIKDLSNKKTASIVVLRGRRRIGKSSLLQKIGREYDLFVEVVGLAPRAGIHNNDQLKNFSEQLSSAVGVPGLKFENWTQAFEALANLTRDKKVFILLDEISWMGSSDRDFVGKLKIAWDKHLSKNPKLILALCGSVSSWIDKNILNNTDFVGRISLSYKLGPLSVDASAKFWGKYKVSAQEKLKVIAITGGIPKYLEEVRPSESAEQNIQNLCFEPSGYLFYDFQKIFNDIFDSRALLYKDIVMALVDKNMTPIELAEYLGQAQNSNFSEYLFDLEEADFIARDYTWDLKNGKKGRLSKLRVKDNYIRFYLKYILPNSDKIEKKIFKYSGLNALKGWNSIAGYLFEGLVLENIQLVLKSLNIASQELLQYGPYFQTSTQRREGCQIDLLIMNRFNNLYLCEIKFREKIGISIVEEVEEKIKKLKLGKNISIRPVLIYCGEISSELSESDYFVKMLDFSTLL